MNEQPLTAAGPKRRRTRAASVMLTGVGGIIGQGIIKCLMDSSYRPVGLDSSEMAAGLYAVPKGYVVPPSRDPAYVDRLLQISAAEEARYIFPGLDMDLPFLSRAADRIKAAGVTAIVSRPEVIDLGDDKLATARFLESHGFPAPRTIDIGDALSIPFPVVLKPRRGGSRSQGVHVVADEKEFNYRRDRIDVSNYVVQEYIEGEEYSCGTVNFDGACHGVAVMKRWLRDGDTHKAHVMRHPDIEAHVRAVAEALKPFGPCNFQLRLRDGVPYIFEFNPRSSGGSYIRALAGFNEPLMTLNWLENGVRPSFEIRPISVFRYWKEVMVDSRKVAETGKTGVVRNLSAGL